MGAKGEEMIGLDEPTRREITAAMLPRDAIADAVRSEVDTYFRQIGSMVVTDPVGDMQVINRMAVEAARMVRWLARDAAERTRGKELQ